MPRAKILRVSLERVQLVVLKVVEGVAMELVGAGLGDDVDGGPGRAAVFG